MIITILVYIALGLVLGFIARAILPGEQKIGLIPTALVGVGGAFLGRFIGEQLGIDMLSLNPWSALSVICGSVLVLVAWCLAMKSFGK